MTTIRSGGSGGAAASTTGIRVLVVSDDLFIQSGLRAVLAEPHVAIVGETATVGGAERGAVELRPEVMINALREPASSVQIVTRMRETCPEIPVLLLGTEYDEHFSAAIGHGASGLFLTPHSAEDLIVAVRIVAAGYTVMPAGHREAVPCPDPLAAVSPDSPLHQLTRRELEVLVLIAMGASNHTVAGRLGLSLSTVKTHVHRILGKLELRNRVQAVMYAHSAGLASGHSSEADLVE